MACWRNPESLGKPKLLLGHGSGLSALCQIGLIRHLSPHYDVHAIDFRGHGKTDLPLPADPDNPWRWYVVDLKHLIDQHFDGQVIYAGQSLSAVAALRLARQSPQSFSALIALDPAILPTRLAWVYPALRRLGWVNRRNHLYQGALRRRNHWQDRDEALSYFTGRKALASWPSEAVEAYVTSCLRPSAQGGLTLSCPREWEARTFKYVPCEIARILERIETPALILRAEQGSIYPKTLKLNRNSNIQQVPGSHFAHMERPDMAANHIHDFISGLQR